MSCEARKFFRISRLHAKVSITVASVRRQPWPLLASRHIRQTRSRLEVVHRSYRPRKN
jgi:hypothetical protein